MNVGFFYPHYEYPPTSGSGVHGYQLATQLAGLGHRILTWYVGGKNPVLEHFRGRELMGFLRSCDVLYVRTDIRYRMELLTLLKGLTAFRTPVVWEINSPPQERFFERQAGMPSRYLERRRRVLARLVDGGIVISKPVYDYARDALRICNLHLIPNGSDAAHFSPRKRVASLYPKPFNAIWIGSTRFAWHGLPVILEVAGQMETIDPEVGFVLVGDRRYLPSTLPSNVLCVGEKPYPEVPPFVASADVGIVVYQGMDRVPGGFYGSPTKLFDYLASGLPVIGHEVGQVAEVIRDGCNGFLCDGTAADLLTKLLRLKGDALLRRSMGEQARQIVERYYNWERVARATEGVLRGVVRARNLDTDHRPGR